MNSDDSGGGGGGGSGPSVVRFGSSSSGGGGVVGVGIPTIVTSSLSSNETPVSGDESSTIANEFENFRLHNASQAQGRRFSVFNKAFDPESSSQGSSDASTGGGVTVNKNSKKRLIIILKLINT